MTEPKEKPVRYMDFVGPRRSQATDPLISRPVSRKPVKVSAQKPVQKPAKKPVIKKPASEKISVEKSSEKPFVARKPASSRDLYPTKESKSDSLKSVKTTDKPVDKTAEKAAAALSGTIKKPDAPDGNSYSLSGKSPFLPNYQIDKRPLSSSIPEKKKEDNFEKLSFLGVNDASSSKKSHKNVYEKSEEIVLEKGKKKKGKKAVKIIDDSDKKSGLPLFLVIILTIILGAAVGAGVYFLLPK